MGEVLAIHHVLTVSSGRHGETFVMQELGQSLAGAIQVEQREHPRLRGLGAGRSGEAQRDEERQAPDHSSLQGYHFFEIHTT